MESRVGQADMQSTGGRRGETTPSEMLLKALQRSRTKTSSGRYLFPNAALRSAINAELVRECFREGTIPPYNHDNFVDFVLHGGRKTFAILGLHRRVDLFQNIVEQDGLRRNHLDSRLPYKLYDLRETFGDNMCAQQFFETQWEFLSPIFSNDLSHRILDRDTILPFKTEELLRKGGCGDIYKTTLIGEHQNITGSQGNVTIVRKAIEKRALNEEQVLSFLHGLRHPSILRLIASYTWNGQHSMLFPLSDCDLDDYLQNPRPIQFQEHHQVLQALLGLSSALESLHTYVSESYQVELIGCHFDLRPKNILVSGDKFLLADFGFSQLKSLEEESETAFKAGVGDYMAPECLSDESEFTSGIIGRASDVWSLGCIFMAVVKHMIGGPSKVESFRTSRKAKVAGIYTHYKFHSQGDVNTSVREELSTLRLSPIRHIRSMGELVTRILQPDSSQRPRMAYVTRKVVFCYLQGVCLEISNRFESLSAISGFNDDALSVELERLRCWQQGVGLLTDFTSTVFEDNFHSCSLNGLESIFTSLQTILDDLSFMVDIGEERTAKISPKPIHMALDRLWNNDNITDKTRSGMRATWLNRTMQGKNAEETKTILQSYFDRGEPKDICILSAMKYMILLEKEKRSCTALKLLIDREMLQISQDGGEPNVGVMRGQDVLIEKIQYASYWIKRGAKDVGRELYERIGAKAEILGLDKKPPDMRTLQCLGYYHDPSSQSFCLVFALPDVSVPTTPGTTREGIFSKRFCTLSELLHCFRKSTDARTRPTLGSLFRLAEAVSRTVARYHQIGWFHKDISAANIVFVPQQKPLSEWINLPYMVGFKHSRQSEINAFSSGANQLEERQLYVHPQYRPTDDQSSVHGNPAPRFEIEYDYYSVGMLLLEIGLWTPLAHINDKMTKKLEGTITPEKRRKKILKGVVPSLGWMAGASYRQAVQFCLDEQSWAGHGVLGEEQNNKLKLFEKEVVQTLAGCQA